MKRLFLTQIAAAFLAAIVFQLGLDPRVAGLIAGGSFILLGLYGVKVSWPERRNRHLTLAVFGLSLIHLFGVALPMLAFRLLNWDEPFSKVSVWGLSGPEFHQVSTRLYLIWTFLVGATWWLENNKGGLRGKGASLARWGETIISRSKIASAKAAALKKNGSSKKS